MEQLILLFQQVGISLTASAIYDIILLSKLENPEKKVANYLVGLNMVNAEIMASNMINILASHQDIVIKATKLYAPNSVSMFSSPNTKLIFGNGSVSTTDKTQIKTSGDAQIIATGGAGIRQDDGTVSIMA